MTFVNMASVKAYSPLKSSHYTFPRAETLRAAYSWCVTDYYSKACLGKKFEACGLLVTGESRVGKTEEIDRLVSEFNTSSLILPNGKAASIVSCLLSKKDSWKELGLKTLDALGYPLEGRRTQAQIWRLIHEQAERQGVIGIFFDECQHIFSKVNEEVNDSICDSFKTLLKERSWPLMLILSGVPALGGYIAAEKVFKGDSGLQLAALLRPVHFDIIDVSKEIEEMNTLLYAFADVAGLKCDRMARRDFFERLDHACVGRWGIVIEVTIDALVRCKVSGSAEVSVKHFVEAYAMRTGLPVGFSPFTAPDYRDAFDQVRLLTLLSDPD